MAKQRERKPSHAYKGCPAGTREPLPDLLARRRWFMGLDVETRCKLVRQTHGMRAKRVGEFYRQLWIDAGRPG